MLHSLCVKNLALIKEAEVEFGPGLNILTGETGAGKSILMGSVHMALGGKVSKDLIRSDSEYAYAELVFDADDAAMGALASMELYPMDERSFVFSRKIYAGRSVCKINGETASAAVMQRAGEILLNVHGQNENQTLLRGSRQLELVDEYAGREARELKEKIRDSYTSYTKLKKALAEDEMDEMARAREISFAEYEIGEIEDAHLKAGEDDELEIRYRKMSNGRAIASTVSGIYGMTGYDSMDSAGEKIGQALRMLGGALRLDDDLNGLYDQLMNLDALLNDFNRELQDYGSSMEFEEEDFREVEDRLNEINRLKDKYGNSIEQILEYLEKKKQVLAELEDYEAVRRRKEAELHEAEKELSFLCGKLSDLRRSAGSDLEKEMVAALKDLNFLSVCFEISWKDTDTYTPTGTDEAEFLISTNPGESLKPLARVASGGELSRMMLGMKAVLAGRDHIGTQIFDEIDAGISGRTAQKVSEKLKAIAGNMQVICITHLPQIAAMADTHFLIEKSTDEGSTRTNVHALGDEESVEELARMLGGARITDAVLANAREMKKLAQ